MDSLWTGLTVHYYFTGDPSSADWQWVMTQFTSVTGISARKYTKHFISYSMWYLLSKIILKTCINNKISFCFNMQELIYENYIKWTCTLVENSIHCAWIFLKRVTWIQEDYLIPWEFLINVWDCENQYSVAIERY